MCISVPGNPVPKGRPRSYRRGNTLGLYTPKETKDYETLIKFFAYPEMRGRGLLSGPINLQLNLHFSIPSSWTRKKHNEALSLIERPTVKPDIDNVLKAWGDALNGVVWEDDKQIVEVMVRKFYSKDPKAMAIISQIVISDEE